MTLRLSRGEFWLLANAVEHGLPLPLLAMPEWVPGGTMNAIDIALNRQGHGLALPSLIETLLQLSRNGWVELVVPTANGSPTRALSTWPPFSTNGACSGTGSTTG